MNENKVSPIQKKRRLIIDRIQYLKSLEWNDFVKQWVGDLHDELEEIDKNLPLTESDYSTEELHRIERRQRGIV